MQGNVDHIATTHVGSLPRPDRLIAAYHALEAGEPMEEHGFRQTLSEAVSGSCAGSTTSASTSPVTASSASRWASASSTVRGGATRGSALVGCRSVPRQLPMTRRRAAPAPGEVVLTTFGDRRDRVRFAEAYADPESGITTGPRPPAPVCVAPITYTGHDAIKADIANFKAAMQAAGVTRGFHELGRPGQRLAYRQRATTRPTRNCSTPAPTRCARNTRRSSRQG